MSGITRWKQKSSIDISFFQFLIYFIPFINVHKIDICANYICVWNVFGLLVMSMFVYTCIARPEIFKFKSNRILCMTISTLSTTTTWPRWLAGNMHAYCSETNTTYYLYYIFLTKFSTSFDIHLCQDQLNCYNNLVVIDGYCQTHYIIFYTKETYL